MNHVLSRALAVLLMALFFQLVSARAEAATYSYKLFDAMTVPQPSVIGGGRVAWWTQYPFHTGIMNRGGRMVISKNPDGTGDARVGDTVQVWANSPYHGSYIFTYNAHRPNCFFEDPPAMPPQDITSYFPVLNDPYDVTVRILDWCGKEKITDTLYLVNITNTPTATPTLKPSPTAAPTATPAPARVAPKPFLDLPWDYRSKGLSFTEAALAIEAFFDHQYPVLSARLMEPGTTDQSVVKFDGTLSPDPYSSHDGYDYAKRAGAALGDPVLAAAGGTASYVSTCEACGNTIVIDHGNGFQTRYMHLMKDGLIVNQSGQQKNVTSRQQIGRVGFSGNVLPPGGAGAHIHFMVVEDKNRDGTFDDNIPDGITDPFGWNSESEDPWEAYKFNYGGLTRSGNKSTYLWSAPTDAAQKTVTPQKPETVSLPKFTVTFPAGTYGEPYKTEARAVPFSPADKSLRAVGNAVFLSAFNESAGSITQFLKLFTIKIEFDKSGLKGIKPATLAIYSSTDGSTWNREDTTVDMKRAVATTSVNHMTYFALVGERKDMVAPTSASNIRIKRVRRTSRQNAVVALTATDNKGGSGVEYLAYRIDGGEWVKYSKKFTISGDGTHDLEFYSVDRDGNAEEAVRQKVTVGKNPTEIGS